MYWTDWLIVDEADWDFGPIEPTGCFVFVQVNRGEENLSWQVKKAGGSWNRGKQAWELLYDQVKCLNIEDRIQQVDN
ncbi:hypothetical protein KFU94_44975 [Chloroflexi bacterium TSY]|nr:hypothetical protein [Chloroflexi bacterium TSY]